MILLFDQRRQRKKKRRNEEICQKFVKDRNEFKAIIDEIIGK
jgi:hypothetical protein